MTEQAKWCTLCQRYVVPKKEFNAIGWVGLVAGLSVFIASLFNEPLARSIMNNTLAAALATGVGNIMLNVLLLLVAPLVLISVVYCIYYSVKQPRCPICNSQSLTDRTSGVSTYYQGETGLGQGVDRSSNVKNPTPIKTPPTQSSALQWPSLDLKWLTKDPWVLALSIIAGISVIVLLIVYAFFSGLISF